METIEHIKQMEKTLNQGEKSLSQTLDNLEEIQQNLDHYQTLFAYYQSPEWFEHFALDEQGKLPVDLPRGVLSEDGIYNFLATYVSLADKLKEVSDKMSQKLDELRPKD
ncbi:MULTISPECIES: DUF4298 domain-containing protein [unclassified Streptococcus]|uniref:DUF4298 domain-containing protein n=1 Tax=unclassified Streptococcus TaxID=2608887 RepID=UPI0011B6F69C|nr:MULTISPECIES: DUF4298 domain-containing protein [unclassified Streptococcus]TWS95268.1 DUF4298 domain-containing protein [Streptococcus sp. sy018]TWT16379.1 DUF4298 domain-containing protein [Streptococcus sp. sy010]